MPLNPTDLLIGQITEEDFKEYTHDLNSQRIDNFSLAAADLTMKFQIPGDKLKAALQWILGVHYMDTGNNLRRSLPMFHPVHNWCWAKSVSVQGLVTDGDDDEAVIWDYQSTPSKWVHYDVEVTFEMPKYNLWADDEIEFEYERFVSKELIPQSELISIDNGEFLYDADGADAWDGKPHVGALPIARRDAAGIMLTWHDVPLEFVQEDDDSLPLKLLQVQGKVNSTTFLGQTAQTLLCNKVKLIKKVSPLVTDSIGQLYFMYDVEIELFHVHQLAADIGKAGETRRGHNLLLGPEAKYWYVATSGGKTPFSAVDYAKIFTHHSDSF